MEKYKDKKSIMEIKGVVSSLKSVGGVMNYMQSLYPDWFLGFYSRFEESQQNEARQKTLNYVNRNKDTKVKSQKIMLVDVLYFDKKQYTNINFFSDFFTQCGFFVVDRFRFQPDPNDSQCLVRVNSKQ